MNEGYLRHLEVELRDVIKEYMRIYKELEIEKKANTNLRDTLLKRDMEIMALKGRAQQAGVRDDIQGDLAFAPSPLDKYPDPLDEDEDELTLEERVTSLETYVEDMARKLNSSIKNIIFLIEQGKG